MTVLITSKPYRDLEQRIEGLELSGTGSPDTWKTNKTALRAETTHNDGDIVGVLPNFVYKYDAASTATDDNDIYITPDDVTGAGRWVRQVVFAEVNHSHPEKVDKVDIPAFNFLKWDNNNDEIVDSGFNEASFVQDETYVKTDNNFTDNYKNQLDNLPSSFDPDTKIDRITGIVAGNVGEITTVTADGQITNSGTKISDILTVITDPGENAFQNIGDYFSVVIGSVSRLFLIDCIYKLSAGANILSGKAQFRYNGAAYDTLQLETYDNFNYSVNLTISGTDVLFRIQYNQDPGVSDIPVLIKLNFV